MLVALKPKPMLAGVADAGAASRSTAAASTAGTSAMIFIFIVQVLPCCHRESVAHPAGDAAPAAPPSQPLNITSVALVSPPGPAKSRSAPTTGTCLSLECGMTLSTPLPPGAPRRHPLGQDACACPL